MAMERTIGGHGIPPLTYVEARAGARGGDGAGEKNLAQIGIRAFLYSTQQCKYVPSELDGHAAIFPVYEAGARHQAQRSVSQNFQKICGVDRDEKTGTQPALLNVLGRIRAQVKSGLENQRAPAKLLTAVDQTLQEKGVTEADASSGTAHFAVLLTILEANLKEREENSLEGELNDALTCPVYLLSQIMPCLDRYVIRSRTTTFSELAVPLMGLGMDDPAYVRSLIALFEAVILSLDGPALAQGILKKEFKMITTMILDPRPKVRKRAQDAVKSILSSPPPPAQRHLWTKITTDFIVRKLDEVAAARGKTKNQSGKEALGNWLCAFTKSLMIYWPIDRVHTLCAVLLRLPKLNEPLLTVAVYETFETLFANSSELLEPGGKISDLFSALLDLRPHDQDIHVLPAWYRIMTEAISVYARLEREQVQKVIPILFKAAFASLNSDNEKIRESAGVLLCTIVDNCVVDYDAQTGQESALNESVEAILQALQAGLTTQYTAAWPEVLTVLRHLITRLGRGHADLTQDHVRIAAKLRGRLPVQQKALAESVLATAVQQYGPQLFFDVLPLGLEEQSSKEQRAWLLPVIKGHIFNTNLSHFISYFAPLSARLYVHAESAKTNGKELESKNITTVIEQIWALLPDYCNFARDVSTAFDPKFGELLANVLYTQAELRNPIFRALENLVQSNRSVLSSSMTESDLENLYGISKQSANANINHLMSMGSNILAVLFNVFDQMADQNKALISECITTYLSILSPSDTAAIYHKVHQLIEQSLHVNAKTTDGRSARVSVMLDLAQTLVQNLDESSLEQLYKVIEELWSHPDGAVQKRSYRILNSILSRPDGRSMVRIKLHGDMSRLLTAQGPARTHVAAKKERFAALITIVTDLADDALYVIPLILTDVVESTKEANEKTRSNAFELLLAMAHRMSRGGTIVQSKLSAEEEMDVGTPATLASLSEFLVMVNATLEGTSPHLASASISTLSRLLFEFRDQLCQAEITALLHSVFFFFSSNSREVLKSLIGFVKVAVIIVPTDDLLPNLEMIVTGILGWSKENKSHFKSKVRHLFERLIRKFGYEAIDSLTPDSDKKLLTNIKKRKDRQRGKSGRTAGLEVDQEMVSKKPVMDYEEVLYGSEEDYESEDESRTPRPNSSRKAEIKASRKAQKNVASIYENIAEPVDFLDKTQLLRAKPQTKGSLSAKHTKNAMKTSSDGRLIVPDEEESVKPGTQKNASPGEFSARGAYYDSIAGEDGLSRNAKGQIRFNKVSKAKRSREQDEMDIESDQPRDSARASQPVKQRRISTGQKTPLGQSFKAKGAGGDRGSGETAPYAYLPLSKIRGRKGYIETTKIDITGKGGKRRRR